MAAVRSAPSPPAPPASARPPAAATATRRSVVARARPQSGHGTPQTLGAARSCNSAQPASATAAAATSMWNLMSRYSQGPIEEPVSLRALRPSSTKSTPRRRKFTAAATKSTKRTIACISGEGVRPPPLPPAAALAAREPKRGCSDNGSGKDSGSAALGRSSGNTRGESSPCAPNDPKNARPASGGWSPAAAVAVRLPAVPICDATKSGSSTAWAAILLPVRRRCPPPPMTTWREASGAPPAARPPEAAGRSRNGEAAVQGGKPPSGHPRRAAAGVAAA
mmetsp:Transcript_109365/g.340755  ORF Transcript_109365/g.340755 Transcript_109365/m.340755 type:complete len:279 (+) Transcript_109365:440-1276(+)